jgi:hypothetical protein
VFTVDMVLHTDRKTRAVDGIIGVMDDYKLFLAHENLSGTVTVTPPEGRTVWYEGVDVQFAGSICFYESLRDVPLCSHTVKVGKEGGCYLSEPKDFDFSIPLETLTIMDSYDGEAVSVRYEVVCTVRRPWYTFHVIRVEPIMVENLEGAVVPMGAMQQGAGAAGVGAGAGEEKGGGAAGGVVSAVVTAIKGEQGAAVMRIDDFGGTCVFDCVKTNYGLDETIKGELRFESVTSPVHKVTLLVLRIELAEGDLNETAVGEQVVFDTAPVSEKNGLEAVKAVDALYLEGTKKKEMEGGAEKGTDSKSKSKPPIARTWGDRWW